MTTAAQHVVPPHLDANPLLSQWISVRADDTIEVRIGKVELGQGISTALAQVAADELDVPLHRIVMVPASTDRSPDQGLTAGSLSVFHTFAPLRLVCANVRGLYVTEAACRWGVDPAEVSVREGVLRAGEESVSYGELTVDLAVVADPAVATKGLDEAREVGRSVPRSDLPDKVTGKPVFVHDLRLPGQLFGRVLRPPSRGAVLVEPGTVPGFDVQVVRDGSFLGVVGAREAEVNAACDRLRATSTWEEHDTLPDEDRLEEFLRAGPHETASVLDERTAPAQGRVLRASYSRPFLAHASIAPSCGVAHWGPDGRLSVWSHSQGITNLRVAIAQALGLPQDRVVVQHVQGAGCYGHNAADDAAFDAVLLARAVPGRPVRVQWSRRDELSWGPFGSAMTADLSAVIDDTDRIRSWSHEVWSQGHTSRPGYAGSAGLLACAHLAEPVEMPAPVDPPLIRGGGTLRNAIPLYDVGARHIVGHRLLQTPIRSSSLRSLGSFLNVFAIESFMDELASFAGHDPLHYRLQHLDDPRAREVLQAAASASGWGSPLADGAGRGIGVARYKERYAYCAVVAEVEAVRSVRLLRLTVAVDVGRVLNPDGLRNQLEGGALQAASWTLKERVRFDKRRITSDDWESYPILRFSEMPEVSVIVLDRPSLPPVGAGEAAQGPTAGAIGNAVAGAVGARVRHLPITTEAVVSAIS
ncbi:MAG TPA: molybdopterin cofactor-binding domain-containing protein [Nocardioidaceae bacterium]|nr:molybdopterin cofactor-binding domain-containing protein [Nocardioidaceae bacterium]